MVLFRYVVRSRGRPLGGPGSIPVEVRDFNLYILHLIFFNIRLSNDVHLAS